MNVLRRLWATLREAYWFIPGIMCVVATVAAVTLTQWDLRRGLDLSAIGWLVANQPSGARALLSMVAGSMITVAGVAFSVTLVALATAAGTYGPRVLNLFSTDRAVQFSLGTFCSTFLYCTLVLRMVGDGSEQDSFVPQLAVLTAIVLAVFSLATFIYFVHHMARSIHVASIVDRSAKQLEHALAQRPPGARLMAEAALPATTQEGRTLVRADSWGYLLPPDWSQLCSIAERTSSTVRILADIGGFISKGSPLAEMEGPHAVEDSTLAEVRAAIPFSRRRSAIGDPDFFIDQLVQIAARALSPGVNDPFTATTCIDVLEGVFSTAESDDPAWAVWHDDQGGPRVFWRRPVYVDHLQAAYDQLWPYAASDPLAGAHLVQSLETLLESRVSAAARFTLAKYLNDAREFGASH